MDETKALQGYKWSCLNACLKNGKNNLLRELVQKPEAESHNVQCLVQNRNRNILRSGNILFEILCKCYLLDSEQCVRTVRVPFIPRSLSFYHVVPLYLTYNT